MSSHETKFFILWQELSEEIGGIPLEREFKFLPDRRYRFDFAHPTTRVAVELEGGHWMKGGGRHNRGSGFEADCLKYFEAVADNWKVFRLTASMITEENVRRIMHYVRMPNVF